MTSAVWTEEPQQAFGFDWTSASQALHVHHNHRVLAGMDTTITLVHRTAFNSVSIPATSNQRFSP